MTSKKKGGRSIAAAFGAFSASAVEEAGSREAQTGREQVRVVAPAFVAAKRSLQDLREERDRLKEQAASGGYRELSPDLIDPSPFVDRLADDDEVTFDRFKANIKEKGQKVPILVRVNPNAEDRFQVVYGHRRLRATRELGIPVKALVGEYTDEELAIAQGIENAERQDLSWIERALFAARMEECGVKPRDIQAALGIDRSELARLRQVTRVIPIDLIEKIGRAPKAGRTRWLLLATAAEKDAGAIARVQTRLAGATGSSDERFQAALASALRTEPPAPPETAALEGGGAVIGKIVFSEKEVRLQVQPAYAAEFADFLKGELPALMKRFAAAAAIAAE